MIASRRRRWRRARIRSRRSWCSACHARIGGPRTSWKISYRVGEPCMPLTPRTIRSRPSVSSRCRSSDGLHVGVLGEIGRLVRDLSPGRRDELADDSRSRLLLRERQPLERPLDVLADDGARAADLAERREPKLARARLPLALPETLEDELEVRSLDAGVGRRLVEHRLDERVLGRELLAAQLAVAGERAEDRGASGVAVEPVEAEEVREQLGDPAGELVELGQRVVAEGEQDVDPRARAGAAAPAASRSAAPRGRGRGCTPRSCRAADGARRSAARRRRPCRRGPPSRRARRTRRAPRRSGARPDPRPTRRARRRARRSARAAAGRRRR